MAWLVTDLPEPDSPTMPRIWPRSSVERQAVDALDQAVLGREVHAQVATDRNASARHGLLVERTSMAAAVTKCRLFRRSGKLTRGSTTA